MTMGDKWPPHLAAWYIRLIRINENPDYQCPCGQCDGEGDASRDKINP